MITLLRKHHRFIISIAILLLAVGLRFYQLGQVPSGMTWDEAAIGYNGFGIWETRRDEWLERLPISFRSFGDYKAPLAIYINAPFTAFFGLNLIAVRLPFAIFGLIAIVGMMLLAFHVFRQSKHAQLYAATAGLITTLSPWHLHFSRTGFESGIALAFIIWGIFFLLKSIDSKFDDYKSLIASVILFSLSLYTYHSAKVFVPTLLLLIAVVYRQLILTKLKVVSLSLIGGTILVSPLVYDSFWGSGLERAGVTIFAKGYSVFEITQIIISNLMSHLGIGYLILGEATSYRHGTGAWGVLLPTTFVLMILGVLVYLSRLKRAYKHNAFSGERSDLGVILGVIIIGLLPAAIALEIPHPNRALLALPGMILMAVYGLRWLVEQSKNYKPRLITIALLHLIFSIVSIRYYFTVFAVQSANDFQEGYIEAFEIAHSYEDQVDKIVFTNEYGQPYIYALFVRRTDPIWWQGGDLIKYEFKDEVSIADLSRSNALIVAGPESEGLDPASAQHLVYGSDGSLRFQIYRSELH